MDRQSERRSDGFKGEKLFVLPTEAFQGYVEHPLVRRLFLTDVGFFPHADNHYHERKEGIEEYIFLYCTEGMGNINVKGKDYKLWMNEAFCIPRNQAHFYCSSKKEPWSVLWVHFKGEDIEYYPLDECKVVSFMSDYATNRMLFLFELLFRVLESNYTLGNFIYISQILSMILAETYFREKKASTLSQNKHVTSIIRYMYKHISESVSLEQVAEEFELSKSYINAIFQKYTQNAPMDFYNKLKMKEACKMLRSSENMYIYDVARRLGYNDQYYFSRFFKKIIGVSPKTYKNSTFVHYKE